MTNRNRYLGTAPLLTLLLSLSAVPVFSAESAPLTPEYAARKENHRKQKEQIHISPDKRKAAAEALKAERSKVYRAKQAVKQSAQPAPIESK